MALEIIKTKYKAFKQNLVLDWLKGEKETKKRTYLSVFIDSGAHQLSRFLVNREYREPVAAGDVLDVEHLDKGATNRTVHCLQLLTFSGFRINEL